METLIGVRGDSIALGARDLERGGRVARLHNYLGNKFLKEHGEYGVVYNLGIDGDTSTGKLKRFMVEAEAREPNIVIFATGGNDCNYTAGRKYIVPPETFRENIKTLITQAKTFTDKVIIMGLIYCDETKTMPIPRVPDLFQDMEGVKLYNTILQEVATQEKALFIDVVDLLNNQDLEDGMHPTAQGHEKLYIKVRDFLLEKKMI